MSVARYKRHGHSRTPEYRAWRDAIQRCTNPNNRHFKDYGARGITVCQEWVDSFETFLAELGPRHEGMSLDRIDNDKGYVSGNCRWATPLQQSINTRTKRNSPFAASGVTWHSVANKFRVSIRSAGKRIYLGLFSDFFEACCARKSAEMVRTHHVEKVVAQPFSNR